MGPSYFFGRIDRGETKTKTKDISVVREADDPNPMVGARVASSNAAPASWSDRIALRPKPARVALPLQLSCRSPDKRRPLGQRLRLECEAVNPNDTPVRNVTYQVAIERAAGDPAVVLEAAPAELAPHAPAKFVLAPALPADAKLGSSMVTVTMTAPSMPPVQQQISLEVVTGSCKDGKLPYREYLKKDRFLRDQLAAGHMTQAEFDQFMGDLAECI